jgi:gas vesicle protein
MSAKGVWIAFGLGVSAGAAVALLYAPQTGVKTRKQLRKGLDDGVDYLEDAAGYLKEQADYLSKEAQKTIKRAKGQVEDAVDKASGVVSDAVKGVSALM